MINILFDSKLKKVSSNKTTSNSLSNGSSKTREFHDEPFGKSYSITVTYDKVIKIFVAFIHIDNQLTLEQEWTNRWTDVQLMDVWVGRLIEGWIYILNRGMGLQMIVYRE